MTNKPVAIVLGGTIPHKALIERLKKRGYYTILIDYFEAPPAAEAADKHIRESAMDEQIVLKIAEAERAQLVICTCLDQQIVVACSVAEKLNLPRPYDYETALAVTNKELMKKRMIDNNIPTSKYIVAGSYSDVENINLRMPIMVKPADCNGAAGVKRVDHLDDLKEAVEDALKWSRTSTAIVEEFVEGIEVSVYSYIQNQKANVLLTSQRFSVLGSKDECIKCFCSIAPADVSPKAYKNMQKISDQIAEAFHLENTPMFYQSIVSGDDVSVIEFAPRLGGGLCFRTIEENTGFDIIDASIDSYLSNDIKIEYTEPKYYYLTHQIHGYPCTFSHIEGLDQLIEDKTIDELYYHKSKGATISDDKSSGARIAAFLAKTKDKTELPVRAKKVIETVDVYDIDGNIKTIKDLYLTQEDL